MKMTQNSLFAQEKSKPLAEELRPQSFEDVIGQDHLLGEEGPLQQMIQNQTISSMILWGPPGSGKTTIARLFATITQGHFETISAIFSGVAELKKIFTAAQDRASMSSQKTVLFVDEIHRFNRAQQDAFLPVVEEGTIILIGATTENPSFELNSALLSRCPVYVLNSLEEKHLAELLSRSLENLNQQDLLTTEAQSILVHLADGDGRFLINALETLIKTHSQKPIDEKKLKQLLQKRATLYDKSQEQHYNLISALHKSLRGSDVQAALYWFCRMLNGGEDPLYIGRRLIRFASEDIGVADPSALQQALASQSTHERLGSPEGELALAQTVVHLATAPKSNACYKAFKAAMQFAKDNASSPPPAHILNAPTNLMKELGYGKGYQYDHEAEDSFSGQNYFPEKLDRQDFYQPTEFGREKIIGERLSYWNKLRDEKSND